MMFSAPSGRFGRSIHTNFGDPPPILLQPRVPPHHELFLYHALPLYMNFAGSPLFLNFRILFNETSCFTFSQYLGSKSLIFVPNATKSSNMTFTVEYTRTSEPRVYLKGLWYFWTLPPPIPKTRKILDFWSFSTPPLTKKMKIIKKYLL